MYSWDGTFKLICSRSVSVDVSRMSLGDSGSAEATGAEDDKEDDVKVVDDDKGRCWLGVYPCCVAMGWKASAEDAIKQTRATVGRFISPAAILPVGRLISVVPACSPC